MENNNNYSCPVCEKPTSKTCSGCHSISYCSVEHQKLDWKVHKKSCRLFEIKCNEKFGRYIVATRDIAAGTIILNEAAIMTGPKQNTFPICLGCNKRLRLEHYYCSKCSIFPMCSADCEKIPIHAENECKIFAKYKPFSNPIKNYDEGNPAYESIMTIRCLLLKEKDAKRWKKLNNMQAQNEVRKSALPGLWSRNELNTVKLLRERCELNQFSETEIHTVIGYSDINSFEIKIDQTEISGLFDNAFLMSHDCISNTHHSFTEDNGQYGIVVRAAIPIKKGQLITTTYAHTLDGTLQRREDLWDSKFFSCNCNRCTDPTESGTYFSALKCKNSGCSGNVLPNNPLERNSKWSCSQCKTCTSSEEVWKITNKIKCEIMSVNRRDSSAIKHFQKLFRKYKALHPNHFLILDIESALVSMYGKMKGWMIGELSLEVLKTKEELCRHVLSILDIIEPGLSRIRGVTLYELHAAIYFSTEKKFAKKQISRADVKLRLEEAMTVLEQSCKILSFDSEGTLEGQIAKSIPVSIAQIKRSIANLC